MSGRLPTLKEMMKNTTRTRSKLIENMRLKIKLENAEKKLFQYELGMCIPRRIKMTEERLIYKFDEKSFGDQMRSLYNDADEKELKQKNRHYKIWQFIIHFSKKSDKRLNKLRELYGGESNRNECHEFCISMSMACKLFPKVQQDRLVLCQKIPYNSLTKEKVYESLSQLLTVKQSQIRDITNFLAIWDELV